MADDDAEDRMLAQEAYTESGLSGKIIFVKDGQELLDYLFNKGNYSDKKKYPRPGIILLDLNMPKKDGREALSEIKADLMLHTIPVIVLTTSQAEEDIVSTYNLGVSSYITKPLRYEGFVTIMKTIGTYWFDIVKLPENKS